MAKNLPFDFLSVRRCVKDHEPLPVLASKVKITLSHFAMEPQGLFFKDSESLCLSCNTVFSRTSS